MPLPRFTLIRRRPPRLAPALTAAATLAAGCAGPPASPPPPNPTSAPASAVAIPVPHDAAAVHNLYRLGPADNIISGGVPLGDAGFDELRRLGVATIISVDGAAPDVARAQARGMRYVHIPITYAEVSEAETLELARAIRDLEPAGAIYIHCHHGKHRSPAATAAAAIALGRISPDQGHEFMLAAGTASNYSGLYTSVAATVPATTAAIDSAPDDFPPVRRATGIVAAMVEIDHAFEHLGDIRAAGWSVPAHHPDLVPAAEAGRLTDNLRISHDDTASPALGTDFTRLLDRAITEAADLEESILQGRPAADLDSKFKLIQASCKECHTAYRDKRRW